MAEQLVQETRTEAAREEPAFPPFNTATFPSQLLWFAVIFGVLYLLMSRVALPRVGGIFEFRRTRIAKDLDEASMMQRQAEAAGAAYDKALADAKAQAQRVAQDMREKVAADTQIKRTDLEGALNARLAAAEAQIAATRTQAMTSVSAIAREAAAAIIQQLTGRPPNAGAVAQAVAALGPR